MENEDLAVRISMCKLCIKTLEEDCKDDPRQPDALAHYKAQLSELEEHLLGVKTYDEMLPKPPDIVIKLKPASLSGKVPTLGG